MKTPIALLWLIRFLALVALGLSGYLTYVSLQTETALGCGFGGFDCEAVLGSPWAKWFGVPVAAAGLVCYVAALIGASMIGLKAESTADIGWRLLEFVVPAALGAAIWFIALQFIAVGSFCIYCLATHACGLVIATLVLVLRHLANRDDPQSSAAAILGATSSPVEEAPAPGVSPPPRLGLATAVGLIGVVLMAVGQIVADVGSQVIVSADDLPTDFQFGQSDSVESETPEVEVNDSSETEVIAEDTESKKPKQTRRLNGSRKVQLLDGRITLDTYKYPILGSPEAPHIIVEMMDYTCPHCREFHEKLTEAIDLYDGKVAVIVLHIPGELLCNPYVKKPKPKNRGACKAAKLAIALSLAEPERFAEFHHVMLQGEEPLPFTAALIEARKFADAQELSSELNSSDVEDRVRMNVELMGALYRANPRFGLPTQILGDQLAIGPPESLDQLLKQWMEAFDLDLPKAELPF